MVQTHPGAQRTSVTSQRLVSVLNRQSLFNRTAIDMTVTSRTCLWKEFFSWIRDIRLLQSINGSGLPEYRLRCHTRLGQLIPSLPAIPGPLSRPGVVDSNTIVRRL